MAVANTIIKVLGINNFADYEQSVYNSYQEKAEREIVNKLNTLLSNIAFLQALKTWGTKCACKYNGYRDITIRLKSGRRWKIRSPQFLKASPKKKEAGPQSVKKEDYGTLVLNYSVLLKK